MSSPSQVESIVIAALEKKTQQELAEYLDQTCGDDDALRLRVEERLKAQTEAADLLVQPSADRADFDTHDVHSKVVDSPTDASATIDSVPVQSAAKATLAHAPTTEASISPRSITEEYRSQTGPDVLFAGRYTLREKIGEGGMGEVWVAKQSEPVKRNVALKLIKQGMDSRAVLRDSSKNARRWP